MNIWTVLKGFLKINCLIDVHFLVLEKISISVKKNIYMLLIFGIRLK